MKGRTFSGAFVAALVLVLAAAYSNSLGGVFTFDDEYVVVANTAIHSLANLPRLFVDPFTMSAWHDNGDLRPIVQTTFALNYAISGLEPWSYHLFAILMHAVAAWLVFVLLRDALIWPAADRGPDGKGRWLAALAALIFAIAPLNTQPVVYSSARSALLCTVFVLAAFLAFTRGRWRWMTLFFALALLSKAIAMSLPLSLLIYDYLYRDRERLPTWRAWLRDWRRLQVPFTLLAVTALIFLGYRHLLMPAWLADVRHVPGVTAWVWLRSQWAAYLYYAWQFLWPSGLSLDHSFDYATSVLQPRAWLSLLVILAWIGAALRMANRNPLITFATLWFFVSLAPESTLLPLAEVVNDHRPYIASSLGLAVLVALGLQYGLGRLKLPSPQALVASACVLSFIAVPVIRHRNWLWQDTYRIWDDAVQKGPENGRAWMNAGVALMRRGELPRARVYLEKAKLLTPAYPQAWLNLSALSVNEGRLDQALVYAEGAVALAPNSAQTELQRGAVYERMGNVIKAVTSYRRCVALAPGDIEASAGLQRLAPGLADAEAMELGVDALYRTKQAPRAVAIFRGILARNPGHYGANFQLARALDAAGQTAEATAAWQRVLQAASAIRDAPTVTEAQARLAPPPPPPAAPTPTEPAAP